MKAILDTHTFLWAIADDKRLSPQAKRVYAGPHDLWLSLASVWEILLKVQSGKLPLPEPAGPYLVKKLGQNRIEVLPITLDHVLEIENLPLHHRDPFDRMLVAQSIHERMPLVTADPLFEKYPVEIIW